VPWLIAKKPKKDEIIQFATNVVYDDSGIFHWVNQILGFREVPMTTDEMLIKIRELGRYDVNARMKPT